MPFRYRTMSRQETDPRLLESRGSGRQLGRFDFRLMVEALNQSQHPTDVLVRAIIDSGRRASQVEVEAIRQRLRSAPFSTRTIRVPPALRTGPSAASALGPSNNALAVHVAQRISLDRQWATTSPELFLEDLRASVEAVSTRMVLYRDRGGAIALRNRGYGGRNTAAATGRRSSSATCHGLFGRPGHYRVGLPGIEPR
jgi:hypothetical protein